MPATATVITIEGLCDTAAPSLAKPATKTPAEECRTQVSRAQFEKLLSAVAPPNPSPDIRRNVANTYGRLLTLAKEGEKLGVDKDPKFQEQVEIFKLQLKAQMAQRQVDTEAQNVSDADLKAYYDSNAPAYEEATLHRVYVPKTPPGSNTAGAGTDAKQVADQARERLAKGDDPTKVQAAAYEQVKAQAEPPPTKREHVRHGASLPPADEPKVFALKAGEVSEVIADPSGFAVYKMEKKEQVPFESVKNDIKTTLGTQRMRDRITSILNSTKTDLNESYFGASQTSPAPPTGPGAPVRPLSGQQKPTPKAGSSAPASSGTTSTSPKK